MTDGVLGAVGQFIDVPVAQALILVLLVTFCIFACYMTWRRWTA